MAVAHVQTVGTSALGGTGGPATSISQVMTGVAVGDLMLVPVTNDTSNGRTVTVDDDRGNTYTLLDSQGPDPNSEQVKVFWSIIATVGAAGAVTTTAHFSGGGEQVIGLICSEYSGTKTSAPTKISQTQATPTTSTDATTSTTLTPATQPGILWGLTYETNTDATPAAGTGFTSRGTFWSWVFAGAVLSARVEEKAISSTSAVAATFTAGANKSHQTFAVYIEPPSSASDFAISPTLTVGMVGKSNAAATVAISPTLTVGMVGASLAAAAVAISPALTVGMVGKSLAAATVAISPTLTITMSAPGSASDVAISPTLTVGLVGKSNAISTLAMSPALTVTMEGNATGSRVYPLAVHSSSGRYFVNQFGEPTPMLEDMDQVFTGHLDQPRISTYLTALRTGGWNCIRHFAFTQDGSGTFDVVNEPNDYYNNVPFSTPNDFSTFSTAGAYAKNLQNAWGKANALEIMINLFTTYMGFNGSPANQGWHEHWTDVGNTNTVAFNLGVKLAQLAQNYPNVNLWWEGDYTSTGTVLARMQNLIAGWQSVMRTRIAGSEPAPPNNVPTAAQTGFTYGTDPATSDQQIQSYYAAGSGANGQGYVEFDSAYDASPTMPTYPTDTPSYNNTWSGGTLSSRKDTRRIRLQVLAVGGIRAGHFFADDDRINTADPDAILATLTDVATADGALVNALVRSLPHWLFRPSGTGTDHAGRTLVGTGIGTGNAKIQASMTSDGAYLLVYVPRTDISTAVTFELDLRGMNGNSRARWWNPTTGAYSTNASAAGTYTLANSASAQSFTTPGDNGTTSGDWILLLDTGGSPATVAISPALTVGLASTSQAVSALAISPSITVGIAGVQASAATVAISPTITFGATGKSNAASALGMSPLIIVAMESQAGALGGTSALWRPQYGVGNQIWRPGSYPGYS